jgi:hypothetical protein
MEPGVRKETLPSRTYERFFSREDVEKIVESFTAKYTPPIEKKDLAALVTYVHAEINLIVREFGFQVGMQFVRQRRADEVREKLRDQTHVALEVDQAGSVTRVGSEDRGDEFYRCPKCSMTTYNPNDIREKYCANCHQFLT